MIPPAMLERLMYDFIARVTACDIAHTIKGKISE
jgi:hypothetical protein